MKRSQFILGLVALGGLAAGCGQLGGGAKQKLVGRWRDGDTVLEFKADDTVHLDYRLLRVNEQPAEGAAEGAPAGPSARMVRGSLEGRYTVDGDAVTITDDADPSRTGSGTLTESGRLRLTISVSVPSESGAAENVEIRHNFEREAAI